MKLFFCNTLWFVSSFSSWLRFYITTFFVKFTQKRILRKILKKNYSSQYLTQFACKSIKDFKKLAISEESDYSGHIYKIMEGRKNVLTCEPVKVLQPTSGTSSGTKLIPYTETLQNQFNNAIKPWIFNIYIGILSLLFGKHYWSISPATPYHCENNSTLKVGFADDTEYLAGFQKKIVSILFAVPSEISQVSNTDSFEYLTLLFLLREKNLRLISIWHPSFLTTLFSKLPKYYSQIINDIKGGNISVPYPIEEELMNKFKKYNYPSLKRAAELEKINIKDNQNVKLIWPKLRIISCWTESGCNNAVDRLREFFPKVYLQPKGIVATEGIFSLPFGSQDKRVAAVNAHYFEFLDVSTNEIIPLWKLVKGKRYSLIITTGGGLYRYKMYDVVEVTDFYNKAPCFSFKGRDNITSDLVGEKLNIQHVENAFQNLRGSFRFLMLAPHIENNRCGYALYFEPNLDIKINYNLLQRRVEKCLEENYHYLHALRVGQLRRLKLFKISENANYVYINHFMKNGCRRGDIKITSLRREENWNKIFSGDFLD